MAILSASALRSQGVRSQACGSIWKAVIRGETTESLLRADSGHSLRNEQMAVVRDLPDLCCIAEMPIPSACSIGYWAGTGPSLRC